MLARGRAGCWRGVLVLCRRGTCLSQKQMFLRGIPFPSFRGAACLTGCDVCFQLSEEPSYGMQSVEMRDLQLQLGCQLPGGPGRPAESCLCVCRWSVMAYETKLPRQASSSTGTEDFSEGSEVFAVAPPRHHLTGLLTSSCCVPRPLVMSCPRLDLQRCRLSLGSR